MVALNDESETFSNGGGGGGGYGSTAEQHVVDTTELRKPLVIDNGNAEDEDSSSICTTTTPPPSKQKPLVFEQEIDLLQDELAGMTKLAVPVILTYILEALPRVVTIILVGRVQCHDDEDSLSMQKLHLDAAALAIMFSNVVALAPAIGLLSAMDTLCSQAHGASQPAKMGTYFLTGAAVMSFIFFTSTIFIWNTTPILIALGQPIQVSQLAGDFAIYTIPGVPFIYVYELIRKVSQARNEAVPMLVSAVAAIFVNVGLGYHLVRWTDWGWTGASVAYSIGNVVLAPTALLGIMMCSGRSSRSKNTSSQSSNDDHQWDTQQYLEVDTTQNASDNLDNEGTEDDTEFLHHLWEGFVVSEALSTKAITEFLSLGFPGMLQCMFEWCAFEVIALLCGLLPGQEAIIGIGANSITMQVSTLCFMVYLGSSIAGSVRIGNALGAGDAHRAEIASNLTLASGAITSILNIALLLSFRKSLPWLFTMDLDIGNEAEDLFLVVAAFQFPDAINGCVQGIFRGSGRQALGAKINFVAYYIIGIPFGCILGLKLGYGVEGLWWGMTAGLFAIATVCTMIVLRSDWKKFALEATTRMNR